MLDCLLEFWSSLCQMTPYVILIVNHNYRNFIFRAIRPPIRHCLSPTIVTGNAAACFIGHRCRTHMPFARSHMEEQFSLQSILLPVSRYKKINAHIGKAQFWTVDGNKNAN